MPPSVSWRSHLVRPQGEGFLFAHALIRDAVYDTLLKAGSASCTGGRPRWFAGRDPVLHAEHLDRADDPGRRGLSARRPVASRRVPLRAGAALVERGLALAVERADRFALACFQGEILHDLGDMAPPGAPIEAALEPRRRARERCQAGSGSRP